ncbi:MAG: hypothetical protein ACFFGZ_11655 [Candidatus Thorarchaeota archaeon]
MYEDELAGFLGESPLEKFLTLEIRRDALYEKFLAIDELHEIAGTWLNEICSKSAETLSLIATLSQLTWSRFKDELIKTPISTLADERRKKLEVRLESLAAFEFQAALLMRLYADMINKGIFGFEGQPFSSHYLGALSHLKHIQNIFFDSEIPTPANLATVASALFNLEQSRRLVNLLELDVLNSKFEEEHRDFILREKGRFFKAQGEMKHRFMHEFLSSASQFWWWEDPVAMGFNLDRAKFHFQNCVKLWKDVPGELGRTAAAIEDTEIPAVTAKANLAQAFHYYALGLTAAEQDSHNVASSYFQEVVRLCDTAQKLQKDLDLRLFSQDLARSTQALKIRTRKLQNKAFLLKGLSSLSKHIGTLIAKLNEDKIEWEEINDLCNFMLSEAESLVETADLRYLSSLPLMFTTIIERTMAKIGKMSELMDSSLKTAILDDLRGILANNMRKISRAIQAVYQNWEDQYVLDRDLIPDEMKSIMGRSENIREAVAVLPVITPNRSEALARIKIVGNLSRSTTIYLESRKATEENVVLDLLLKAKSHYFAREALTTLDSMQLDQPFVEEEVRKQFSRSLVAGYNAEMSMFSLLAQWWHFNRSGPALAQVYNMEVPTRALSPEARSALLADAEKDLQSCETFLVMLRRIQTDSSALLTHRLMFGEIVEGVLWEVVERRVNMALGVIQFLECILNATLADLAIRLGGTKEARKYFTKAQELAFSASSAFGEIDGIKSIQHLADLPENVYSFGQFCQHALVGLETKMERVPLQGLLELYRKTLFSL